MTYTPDPLKGTAPGTPVPGSLAGPGTPVGGEASPSLAERAKDTAATVMSKTREVASSVAETVQDAASTAAQKTSAIASNIGDRAQGATAAVVSGVEAGGAYVREEAGDLFRELTTLIRRHPIPALAVGFALGLLLARVTRD